MQFQNLSIKATLNIGINTKNNILEGKKVVITYKRIKII